MNIATRIEIAMKVSGIKSQADLSRLAGVSEASISRIMKGEALPSLDNAAILAKTLSVTIDWLVNGEDNKTTEAIEFPLIHVRQWELKLLTLIRQASPEARELILAAVAAAEKLPLHQDAAPASPPDPHCDTPDGNQ